MPNLRGPLRALQLAALLATIASAARVRPSHIFERADGDNGTCAADFAKCSEAGLPDDFCCPQGSSCIALAANTTILCCPEGNTCKVISAITCNLSLQDPAANPEAEIKTTVLDGKLETCGSGCCPFGYRCNGKDCVMEDDQSKPPAAPSPSPTGAPTPSPSPPPASEQSTTIQVVDGTSTPAPVTDAPASGSSSNTVAIIGGVVGGLAALMLAVAALFFCRVRRRKRAEGKGERHRRESSTSSFGNIISAPVPHANYPSQRLDFLAKAQENKAPATPPRSGASSPTAVAASSPPSPSRSRRQPPPMHENPFSPSFASFLGSGGGGDDAATRRPDTADTTARSHHASAEITGLRSLTHGSPQQQRPRAPARQDSGGSQNIDVFADPFTVAGAGRGFLDVPGAATDRNSSATTWSGIQHRADQPRTRAPGPSRMRWG
ncbi:hypothetical protein GGS23DRAFT_611362 [Durotheca rogersii]|uniref:uncharacterized protein n=1 Tax=Durotheca rogersii TaxID=419775 RepID=UPI00221EFD5F|nr:uncharacterized protein GGS23DRAFT_611362 [Durotheca rogersii]KAI5861775.1 hypothetical protein GGS23DRAFT_611362 [Durotheca rogersii]